MEEHGELENLRDEVLKAVSVPERILQGTAGELLAIREIEPGKYLVVIYRETDDGFIITAFLTRRMRWIEKRVQVWP
jgi:plasmid stabilization system protein ParE